MSYYNAYPTRSHDNKNNMKVIRSMRYFNLFVDYNAFIFVLLSWASYVILWDGLETCEGIKKITYLIFERMKRNN